MTGFVVQGHILRSYLNYVQNIKSTNAPIMISVKMFTAEPDVYSEGSCWKTLIEYAMNLFPLLDVKCGLNNNITIQTTLGDRNAPYALAIIPHTSVWYHAIDEHIYLQRLV